MSEICNDVVDIVSHEVGVTQCHEASAFCIVGLMRVGSVVKYDEMAAAERRAGHD